MGSIKSHIHHTFDNIPLGNITTDQLENFFSRLKRKGNPSPFQVRLHTKAISLTDTIPLPYKRNSSMPESSNMVPPSILYSCSRTKVPSSTVTTVHLDSSTVTSIHLDHQYSLDSSPSHTPDNIKSIVSLEI